MDRRISCYLLLSQLSLFAFLAICLTIFPGLLFDRSEAGVSNYGVRVATAVPFSLGFLLCSVCILRAAVIVPRSPPILDHFRQALLTLGALVVLVLASTYPYKINVELKDFHIVAGALLISFEMAMSLWMTLVILTDWTNAVVVLVQASGCLLALITLVGVLHLLLLAQLIASAAFGVVLVRVGLQLVERHDLGEFRE